MSSQDLFFEIWSNLLDQLKNNNRPEHLEKLLNFSCFKEDFLQVSLNKIDELIEDGIDINLPFYIHPPRGYTYTKENALRQTIQIYNFGYINKYVYNNRDSKHYLEELIYYLLHRCQPDINIITFIVGHKKLYKILEDLLKRFNGKIDFSDYKISTAYIGYIETEYLEILLGFSCLDLDKKIIYSYRKISILPIESILIEYILNYALEEYEESDKQSESNDFYSLGRYKGVYNVYKERKTLIKNNIFLLKKYSPEPSYNEVLRIVKKDFKIFSSKDKDIKEEDITNLVTKVFFYFDYKIQEYIQE